LTGNAIEKTRAPGQVAVSDDERRWAQLQRMANVYSKTALVPKAMQGQPDTVMAAMLLCDALGVDPKTNLMQLDVIDGHLEPRGQMYASVAWINGYDVRPVVTTNERCVVKIRDANDPDDDWLEIEFNIEDARRAHLLDVWVEQWFKAAGDKYERAHKYVVGNDLGFDQALIDGAPDWACRQIEVGAFKHKDNWFNYPADMLFPKAIKRAIKRRASHVMAGLSRTAQALGTPVAVVIDDDDEQIVDGEVVETPAAGEATPAPRDPDFPPRPADQATTVERSAMHMLLDGLDSDARGRLKEMATAEKIPNIDGARFTHDHAARFLELVAVVSAPQPAVPSAGEEAGPGGDGDLRSSEAAAPAVQDDPGRPF
jgi:hypothetical protein